uniref:Uncharacterized protein n=1 Tax=Spongospora subterranea TaxID=70186 RepID=A0A0H5QX36_9EUKA|eukprot:CRZ06503.1 hypothetical protein [Spongospora subterranea]
MTIIEKLIAKNLINSQRTICSQKSLESSLSVLKESVKASHSTYASLSTYKGGQNCLLLIGKSSRANQTINSQEITKSKLTTKHYLVASSPIGQMETGFKRAIRL